jgi:hypothetical protein
MGEEEVDDVIPLAVNLGAVFDEVKLLNDKIKKLEARMVTLLLVGDSMAKVCEFEFGSSAEDTTKPWYEVSKSARILMNLNDKNYPNKN